MVKEKKFGKKKYPHSGFVIDEEKPIHHPDGSITWYRKRTDLKL